MNSVNKVVLLGNVGKQPEVRSFQAGGKSVSFSVATKESWKDKASGQWKDRTQWTNVVIFNDAIATRAEKYLNSGSKVYIEGQLESRKYTGKDGVERHVTEVVLRQYKGELVILDDKSDAPKQEHKEVEDLDEDIPF